MKLHYYAVLFLLFVVIVSPLVQAQSSSKLLSSWPINWWEPAFLKSIDYDIASYDKYRAAYDDMFTRVSIHHSDVGKKIDIAANTGTPVKAVSSGVVSFVGRTPGGEFDSYGCVILISHKFPKCKPKIVQEIEKKRKINTDCFVIITSLYAHLNTKDGTQAGTCNFLVKKDEAVSAGQYIAHSGDTDSPGKKHLHFETRRLLKCIDKSNTKVVYKSPGTNDPECSKYGCAYGIRGEVFDYLPKTAPVTAKYFDDWLKKQ